MHKSTQGEVFKVSSMGKMKAGCATHPLQAALEIPAPVRNISPMFTEHDTALTSPTRQDMKKLTKP